MAKDKQLKRPYLAPKCEVIQVETCNLMAISASMGGFEYGGTLSKKVSFDNEEDFDFGTDNTQTRKEEQP
ncbi:hypothetical protein [Prevotella melaninogenica]|uniref:Uncharacterized protein n=1 Tax=Prevotella melaninogenica DNF00666 TaxID=1401073 RepID=A0A096AN96_9BACT|nr:hypothetical protein [Prevotella melaninogenica]KGF48568.1 hypothetical protein HMPREF0661_06705 [Prevotella melaninogenica DNF00666]